MDPVLEGLKLALAVVLLVAGVRAFLLYGKRKYEEDARSGDFRRYKGAARDRIEAYAAELKAEDLAKREANKAFTEDVKAGLWADIERSLDAREGRE